ncbi:MAG: CDP-diacylglycerol--glycerol-3-phosphate 3-phosphatidyltransferase [Planctomycetota bacterium]|nr:CDP-diacylglycerol--glycerol-3-phosphate 3-phosphatidyltransferase [Planctomycetota bacterium]
MTQSVSPLSTNPWNVPNALSLIRLFMAVAVCACIEIQSWTPALILFVIAASTDWIDGWWARKYQQVTKLGRILDPFVDKVIICGAMIALASAKDSPMAPWMATLVVARELLVTSLRGMVEGQGGDFSAKQLGKWKMVLQCAAVIASLLYLRALPEVPAWLKGLVPICIWGSILLTVLSAIEYIMVIVRNKKTKTE